MKAQTERTEESTHPSSPFPFPHLTCASFSMLMESEILGAGAAFFLPKRFMMHA